MSRRQGFLSLLSIFIIMIACSAQSGSQEKGILAFSAGSCDSEKANPWDTSTLGVKSVEWPDDTTLRVKAFVSLNCASKIARGDFETVDDTIILKYIWSNPTRAGKEMVTHCMCAQELIYTFKYMVKKDYRYRMESVKDMSYSSEM